MYCLDFWLLILLLTPKSFKERGRPCTLGLKDSARTRAMVIGRRDSKLEVNRWKQGTTEEEKEMGWETKEASKPHRQHAIRLRDALIHKKCRVQYKSYQPIL